MLRNTQKIIEKTKKMMPARKDLMFHDIVEIKRMSSESNGDEFFNCIVNAYMFGFHQGKQYQKKYQKGETA